MKRSTKMTLRSSRKKQKVPTGAIAVSHPITTPIISEPTLTVKKEEPKIEEKKEEKIEIEEIDIFENNNTICYTDEEIDDEFHSKKVKTLERTSTFTLPTEEQLEKRLSRSLSSLRGDLNTISTLDSELQHKLEKKLSTVLQPQNSFNNISLRVIGGVDEEEYEIETKENEETEENLEQLPVEMIVEIFQMLEDEDKIQLSMVSKFFRSIFILHVGLDKVVLFEYKSIDSLNDLVSPGFGTSFTEATEVEYFTFYSTPALSWSSGNQGILEGNNSVPKCQKHTLSRKLSILLVYHPTEIRGESTSFQSLFLNHAKKEKFEHKKQIVAAIPISERSSNYYLSFPSLVRRMFIGNRELKFQKYRPSYWNNFAYQPAAFESKTQKGIDPAKHFTTFCFNIKDEDKVEFKCLFNMKQCARYWRVNHSLRKNTKSMLLQLAVKHSIKTGAVMKWNFVTKEISKRTKPIAQPIEMKLPLFEYQLKALSWMKNIEDGVGSKRYTFSKIAKAPGYPLLDFYINAGPFDFQEPKNFEIIENPNDISQRTHPHLFDTFTVRGGFYADEMGLGKTITMVSLILLNSRKSTDTVVGERPKAHFEAKTTLIICPNQLIYQWEKEIKNNSNLSVLLVTKITDLKKHKIKTVLETDVIITSHQFLTTNRSYMEKMGPIGEFKTKLNSFKDISEEEKMHFLQLIGWHRIILDEGHEILSDNEGALRKDLFDTFLSNYRWYVTGTPVPRGRDSLVGALNFLDIKLDSSTILTDTVLNNQAAFELPLFQAIKHSFYWRNTKESVRNQMTIPPFVEFIENIQLSPYEQAIYEAAKAAGDKDSMRQICSHPHESTLVQKVESNGVPISVIAKNLLGYFRDNLESSRESMTKARDSLPQCIRAEEEAQKNYEKILSKKPLEKDLPKKKDERTKIIEKWEKKHDSKLSRLQNAKDKLLSTRTRTFTLEHNIITLVAQYACMSRILISNPNLSECPLCSETLVAPEITKCNHTFCSTCILSFIRVNGHCPTCITSLKITDLTSVNKQNEKLIDLPKVSSAPIRKPVLKRKPLPKKKSPKRKGRGRTKKQTKKKEEKKEEGEEMEENEEENKENGEENKEDEEKKENEDSKMDESENIISNTDEIKVDEDELDEEIVKNWKDSTWFDNVTEFHGSKISSLLKYLQQLLSTKRQTKLIIFSKFDTLLNTLGNMMNNLFNRSDPTNPLFVSCKGNVIQRKKILDQFNSLEKNSPRILLLSLTNAASGTHLTVATHIVLVDPVSGSKEDAKSTDAQAIARSHRLGQDKQVVVVRFIVENTIDQDDYNFAYADAF